LETWPKGLNRATNGLSGRRRLVCRHKEPASFVFSQRPLRRGTEKGSDVQNVELLIYPVPSPANLYSGEPQGSTVINFKDYAVLADHWLEEGLYPASP